MSNLIYDLEGCNGKYLRVYDDKCVFGTQGVFWSMSYNNPGEKTVYYTDCLGLQCRPQRGGILGAIHLQTASESNPNINLSDSTFLYNKKVFFNGNKVDNDALYEVEDYIRKKFEEAREKKNNPTYTTVAAPSSADELLKFKQLLDSGVITQDEFDAKKKQLLGL